VSFTSPATLVCLFLIGSSTELELSCAAGHQNDSDVVQQELIPPDLDLQDPRVAKKLTKLRWSRNHSSTVADERNRRRLNFRHRYRKPSPFAFLSPLQEAVAVIISVNAKRNRRETISIPILLQHPTQLQQAIQVLYFLRQSKVP
jgi:hypothetical protein